MERLFEKFRKKKDKPENQPEKIRADYQFDPTQIYDLIGDKADYRSDCHSCGGPYTSPLETVCGYCGNQRLTFYRNVTPKLSLPENKEIIPNDKFEFPHIGRGRIDIDEYVTTATAMADKVTVGYNSNVNKIYAKTEAIIGEQVNCNTLVSPSIQVDYSSEIDVAIARSCELGEDVKIQQLITLPNSTVSIDYNCQIEELILGPKAKKLVLGEQSHIGTLKSVDSSEDRQQEYYSSIENEKHISLEEYYLLLQKTLDLLKV